MSQRKGLGNREIALDEFRSLLGIENTKTYNSYGKIKEKILEVSKREINKKTDLTISYSEVKKSRKVEAIKFKITQKVIQEEKANTVLSA